MSVPADGVPEESLDTSDEPEESVDTSDEMAGLPDARAAATAPHPHAGGPQVVAGRLAADPVARSICRSDQPRRPRARICCRFSSAKTLLMPRRNTQFLAGVNVSGRYRKWPVFNRPLMAGLGVHRGA